MIWQQETDSLKEKLNIFKWQEKVVDIQVYLLSYSLQKLCFNWVPEIKETVYKNKLINGVYCINCSYCSPYVLVRQATCIPS